MKKNSTLAVAGAIVLAAGAAWFGVDLTTSPQRIDDPASTSGLATCPVDSLPDQAPPVIDDILAGGPYEYPGEDGGHFGNYEGVLPDERSSYYRSFTVDTPGLRHRGERRIVVGGGSKSDPDVWYYSDDHYGSFCEIPDAED